MGKRPPFAGVSWLRGSLPSVRGSVPTRPVSWRSKSSRLTGPSTRFRESGNFSRTEFVPRCVPQLGLDVVTPEPLPPEHPLWSTPGALLTPHVAYGAPYHERREAILLENCRCFTSGAPILERRRQGDLVLRSAATAYGDVSSTRERRRVRAAGVLQSRAPWMRPTSRPWRSIRYAVGGPQTP
jgi:hypothetical protein